jgi:DNA-binding response OmpR family regulator
MLARHTTKEILLAEDDPDDVDFFETAIKGTNIPVDIRHARDGEELFVELQKAVPNILFLDIQMPCKDGISCILQIRKNREYDQLPVIMFTSLSHQQYVDKTYRYGANYYVIKPLSIASLIQKLRYILSVEWEKQLYYPPKSEYLLS